jgi:hypothetical protein
MYVFVLIAGSFVEGAAAARRQQLNGGSTSTVGKKVGSFFPCLSEKRG